MAPQPPTPTRHSRPTTPLRTPTRTSFSPFRSSTTTTNPSFPLDSLTSQFAELSDSLLYLQENLGDLQQMHESLSRFSESFAGFLYGLNMNAYCVEFPEAPGKESWEREREGALDGNGVEDGEHMDIDGGDGGRDAHGRVPRLTTPGLTPGRGWREDLGEATFMTNETSFVNEPPVSEKKPATKKPEAKTPAPRRGGAGGIPTRGGRGAARGGSGVPRGIPRPRAKGTSSFK